MKTGARREGQPHGDERKAIVFEQNDGESVVELALLHRRQVVGRQRRSLRRLGAVDGLAGGRGAQSQQGKQAGTAHFFSFGAGMISRPASFSRIIYFFYMALICSRV